MPAGRLRHQLLQEVHDAKWAGHPGRERTLALLARSYYSPKMEHEVVAYIKFMHGLSTLQNRDEEGGGSPTTSVDSEQALAISHCGLHLGIPKCKWV